MQIFDLLPNSKLLPMEVVVPLIDKIKDVNNSQRFDLVVEYQILLNSNISARLIQDVFKSWDLVSRIVPSIEDECDYNIKYIFENNGMQLRLFQGVKLNIFLVQDINSFCSNNIIQVNEVKDLIPFNIQL